MSVAYLVIYEGQPDDPEAFLDYYLHHHLPIIWTWPRIRQIEIEVPTDGDDAMANPSDIFLIARFLFDSAEELQAALQSPERLKAREDSYNFPPFTGTMRHQAVRRIDVSPNR